MKTAFVSSIATLAFISLANSLVAADLAAEQLARNGAIAVRQAGPYVETGTMRVQVEAKLGRPDLVLRDGTWLYQNRRVGDSAASGTLVVRFASGRVASLTLATPAVVAALRAEKADDANRQFAASK